MRCEKCGKEYPSKYYFITDTLCQTCFELLGESEQHEIKRGLESLASESAGPRTVAGHALRCAICGGERFWKRKTLMNTPGMTFFGVEWANRQAENYVCERCGHVLWFLREESARPVA